MTKPAKHKKWLKILGVFMLLICGLLVIAYYIAVYRIKDVLQLVVEKESNGLYTLQADNVDLSFVKRRVILKNVSLNCTDTLKADRHYSVQVPDIYLSIHSFRQILFHKHVVVDSISLGEPQLLLHDHQHSEKKITAAAEAPNILSSLQNILAHLEVKKFHLRQGSFYYSNKFQPAALKGSHINFSVIGFSRQNNSNGRFFASDDITLDITDQSWQLPDGNHQIGFKKLHFSGRSQLFELDSCTIVAKGADQRPGFTFYAEKLFFNSSDLARVYESRELFIDTLICVKPALLFQPATNTPSDTGRSTKTFQLFNKLYVGYADIRDGEFLISKGNQPPSYITPRENLQVYNLIIDPSHEQPLSVDSVRLNLQSIAFVTKDSLFELSIESFDFGKNELTLRNAHYGPTKKNSLHRGMAFSAPYLRIENISLADLLQKKLSGTIAVLDRPFVRLTAPPSTNNTDTTNKKQQDKIELFYNNLHGLGELLVVDSLKIRQGQLTYLAASKNLAANLKGFEALLLMKDLLRSDSMIEIKHAMPYLKVAEASVKSSELNLQVNNYLFKGKTRQNYIDRFDLTLNSKKHIVAKKIYWEAFDWDIYARSKEIQVQSLNIAETAIHIKPTNIPVQQNTGNLPVIRIAKVLLNKLSLDLFTKGNAHLQLSGNNVSLDNLITLKKFFLWQNLSALFRQTEFTKPGVVVAVPSLQLNAGAEDVLEGLTIKINSEEKDVKVMVPVIKTKLALSSTDPSSFNIASLIIQRPSIDITLLKKNTSPASPQSQKKLPFELNTSVFRLQDAQINYKDLTNKTTIHTAADLRLTGLQLFNNSPGLLKFAHSSLAISDFRYQQNNRKASLAHADLELQRGTLGKDVAKKWLLNTAAGLQWQDLSIEIKRTDSTGLSVKNKSGSMTDKDFALKGGEKSSWNKLLNHIQVGKTDVQYASEHLMMGINGISWQGQDRRLTTEDFHLTPRSDMDKTFSTAEWQKDYMEITGRSLAVHGLNLYPRANKTALEINKVQLDSVHLITARDKRSPFRHGIEVLMPTPLLNSLKLPVKLDSVVVRNSAVTVYEISQITLKKGRIPLTDLNALITNVTNHPSDKDSLTILANASVLRNRITNMRYQEAYNDSLSGFTLNVNIAPMQLTHFSDATEPLASVKVHKGYADTLYASWIGNKYAAFGTMNFHYNDLAIRVLDKKEPGRKKILPSLETWLANLILRNKNKKQSLVYMQRNREKFIFNYWVKTSMSGLLTSAGIKGNRKYYKNWKRFLKEHQLESWGTPD